MKPLITPVRAPAKALCLVIAGGVALCGTVVHAQDDRPIGQFGSGQNDASVRMLGQTSPGLIPSYPLQSDALRREMQPSSGHESGGAALHGSAPISLEGAEAVAWESMHPQRFSWEMGLLAGWEYDDNPFLSGTASDGRQTPVRGGTDSYYARIPISMKYAGGLMNVAVSYVPEYRVYDGDGINNTFNQAGSAALTYADEKLQVGFDVNLAQTDGGNVEVGDRVNAFVIMNSLNASYAVSSRTSIGTSLSFSDNDYQTFNSYKRYAAQVFTDYKVTPKTQIGLGVGYDWTDVEDGASSKALNVSARINWQVTEKISLRGSAGGEWRQYDDATSALLSSPDTTVSMIPGASLGSGSKIVSPIFSFGAFYAMRENTSLTLDAYRRSNPSISEIDQNYYSTGVLVAVTQKFLERFTFSLGVGYENADYRASVTGIAADRSDNYFYVRPQLMYTLGKQLTLGTYYQYSKNDSSGGDGVTFNRNTVGGTVTYNF